MPKQEVKTLKSTCQETLTKYLDVLLDVGCIPYSLIKDSLVHATPQQLYKIERSNPDTIAIESDELWLRHCLLFKDIREEYEQGLHRDSKKWRELYLNRYQENEHKRQLIKQKVKSQYNKIQNEKEKRSIKVLHGVVPTTKRSYEAARRSTMSKLFQQTKREADKIASIYQSPKRSTSSNNSYHSNSVVFAPALPTVIRVPKPASRLTQAYRDNKSKYPRLDSPPAAAPLIAPTSRPIPSLENHGKCTKRPNSNRSNADSNHEKKKKKPTAIVNFNIFNELS